MRTSFIFIGLALFAVAGTACAPTYEGVELAPQPAPAAPFLQACASHAAKAQRAIYGNSFRVLQLESTGLAVNTPRTGFVGAQPVAWAYDGTGTWVGMPHGTYGEWRRVHFHCLVSPTGKAVYSYVRPE